MVIITVPADEYSDKCAALLDLLEKILPKGTLDSVAHDERESIISYSFRRLEKQTLLALQREIGQVTSGAKSNVFFSRAAPV